MAHAYWALVPWTTFTAVSTAVEMGGYCILCTLWGWNEALLSGNNKYMDRTQFVVTPIEMKWTFLRCIKDWDQIMC